MKPNKPIVYFSGVAAGEECHISSNVWQFGSHTIPTHAISDVYVSERKNRPGIIISALVVITSLILLCLGEVFLVIFFPILCVALFALLKFIFCRSRRIVIVSKGDRTVSLFFRKEGYKNAKKIYEAMIMCLDEGSDSHIVSSVFNGVEIKEDNGEINEAQEQDMMTKVEECAFKEGEIVLYNPQNIKVKIHSIKGSEAICRKDNGIGIYIVDEFSCKITDLAKQK